MKNIKKVVVIGGGPAGICAALAAASKGYDVTLLEQNEKIGKKLYITGKGRCNLTNLCDREAFFEQLVHNPRFMYSAYAAFNQENLMDLIEENGCPLKVERGRRVFPESDKSSDIIKAFRRALDRAGVRIQYGCRVNRIVTEDLLNGQKKVSGIALKDGRFIFCDGIILATGGLTYPSTGSDGSGLKIAESLGHKIISCRPSLVGLVTKEKWPIQLQGLSLKTLKPQFLRNS